MKQLRLVLLVIAATAWTAVAAFACPDDGKGASAANAKGSCSAHGVSAAASAATCPATASCPAGSAQCKAAGTSASAASMSAAASRAQCTAAMSAQCTAAMRAQCAKGTKTSAITAASMDCCAGKGASASAAAAAGNCAAHGARSAAMAKGAVGCGAAGAMAGMGHCDTKGAAHMDCSVCNDEATCANDLRGAGVRSQVVALRNGAMIVYTADNAASVRALQTTVARYNEHIMNAYAGGGDATLCGGCKSFRGAMASGKFSRELVNVKNGCQILLTSTDRNIVRKIHDSMAPQVAARVRT